MVADDVVGGVPGQTQGFVPPPSYSLASSSSLAYDEQLGLTFTQNFYSMLYNVTAVEQSDPTSGAGPAYLLQGLSDSGYWYQVSLLYNWPYINGGYNPGFHVGYEVFDPSGSSIYPANGGTGFLTFSGPVNPGDSVILNLYFGTSGQVVMLVQDQNTGAAASTTYSDEGATFFAGSPASTSNVNGFFTGLMTEWYHPSPYYGDELRVVYSSSYALSSAWMWIDEYSPPCCSNSLFYSRTTGPVSYTDPYALHEFSSNGAHEYSNAYTFITGSLSLVSETLSYTIEGGGSGYSPPTLHYYQNGAPLASNLTNAPTPYLMDPGSQWGVSDTLQGSGASERWATPQSVAGVVNASQTIDFVYFHQFDLTLSYEVVGGGGATPLAAGIYFGSQIGRALNASQVTQWFDAGTSVSLSEFPSGTQAERWYRSGGSVVVTGPISIAATYYHQFYVTINTAQPEGGSIPPSGWYNASSTLQLTAQPNTGWEFEEWTGGGASSYSGYSASTAVIVNSALVENATFYPGLTVTDGAFGQVTYSWDLTSATLTSGHNVVYVPVGTVVSLEAAPSSILSTFTGYTGTFESTNPSASVTVNGPSQVEATFAPNYPVIGGVAGGIVVVVAVGVYAFRTRHRVGLGAPASPEAWPT